MKKTSFRDEEMIGLTGPDIRCATLYLRKNGTKGAIPIHAAYPLFEMFIIGYTIEEIYKQYPQYSYDQIACTAALQKWGQQKEDASRTLLDTIKAKVTKTMTNQVDFLTGLLNCFAKESEDEIRAFLSGLSDQPPTNGIKSLKDYHEVIKALQTLLAKNSTILDGAIGTSSESAMKARYDKSLTVYQQEHQDSVKTSSEVEDIINGEVIVE